MSIRVPCTHCGRQYNLDDRFAGRRVTCQECKRPFLVPAAAAPDDGVGGFLLAELDAPPLKQPTDESLQSPVPRPVTTYRAPKVARQRREIKGHSRLMWAGINGIVFGEGSFVLPMFGLQWRRMHHAGEAQPYIGGILIVIGVGCLVASLNAD